MLANVQPPSGGEITPSCCCWRGSACELEKSATWFWRTLIGKTAASPFVAREIQLHSYPSPPRRGRPLPPICGTAGLGHRATGDCSFGFEHPDRLQRSRFCWVGGQPAPLWSSETTEGRKGFTTAVIRLSERRVPILSLKGCELISPEHSEAPPRVTVHSGERKPCRGDTPCPWHATRHRHRDLASAAETWTERRSGGRPWRAPRH